MLLKDNGEPSQTVTLMWLGVAVALLKLLLSGAEWNGLKAGEFSGADFALVVSPFLALYGHKKQGMAKLEANRNKEQMDAPEQSKLRKRL